MDPDALSSSHEKNKEKINMLFLKSFLSHTHCSLYTVGVCEEYIWKVKGKFPQR